MSETISNTNEKPHEIEWKRIAFWVGFGFVGLFLLGGIYLFIIQQVHQNWKTSSDVFYRDLAVDSQGRVWGLTDESIDLFDSTGNVEPIALDRELIESRSLSLALDSKGHIWVGTESAVGLWDFNGEWRIFSPANNLDDSRVYDMVVDGQDRAWINIGWYGNSGLSVIDPARDTGATYTSSNSGLDGIALSIAVDPQGNVWCAVDDHRLMVLGADGKWESRATLPGSESGYSLVIDHQGSAWVGSQGTIHHLDTNNQWVAYLIGDQGAVNYIEEMLIDHNGRVWAGSVYQGVFMFDGSADWISYNSSNSGLNNDSVTAMVVDGENRLWIVAGDTLNQFDAGTTLSATGSGTNQGNTERFARLKNNLPVLAFEIVLIAILGITVGTPKALQMLNIPHLIIGFAGWYLIFGVYWGVIDSWASGLGAAAMVIIVCFVPPLPANILAVIVLMAKPRWRWAGAGILLALLTNSIGMLFQGTDAAIALINLFGCIPFFISV